LIKCGCNFGHSSHCNNNTCVTDLGCVRTVKYTNGVITVNDQYCIALIPTTCGTVLKDYDGTSTSVIVTYCCRTTNCNKNDTLLENFIRSQLGMCLQSAFSVLICLHMHAYIIQYGSICIVVVCGRVPQKETA